MKLKAWAKENKARIIITGLMGLLPLLFCTIYCGIYGKTIGDIYLPNSYWNDELFYFKQVEGILKHGVPGGYFGFNESHGRILSFAAWSPVLLSVWVSWGLLFGFHLLSPIICNLLVISVCMAAFAWMARPTRRQAVTVAVLLGICSPFTRYIMSMSLEVLCCSLLLVYAGALFGYEREKKNRYLWIMLAVSALLTLTRPYFLLFMLYPAFFYGRQGGKKWIAAVGLPLFSFGGYVLLKYFLSAEYLSSLFDVSVVTIFFEKGISAGFKNLWTSGCEGVLLVLDFIKRGIRYGHFSGCMYAVYGITGLLLLGVVILEWKKRRTNPACRRMCAMLFAMLAMILAILYMYKAHEGSRHLLTFVMLGILLLGMYSSKKGVLLQLALAGALGFFFLVRAGTPYDYLVPFDDGVVSKEVSTMQESLQEKMELKEGITWDNTVIWLASDIVDGEGTIAAWQQLYAIPGGFGINYCAYDYISGNLANVHSRYIAAIPGGNIEKELLEEGAKLLAANDKIAVYDRRPDEGN